MHYLKKCWGACVLALILLQFAGKAYAEINLVQDTSQTAEGSTTVSATFSATPTEGNLLVAIAGARVGSAAPTTPSGWSVAISQPTGSPGQIIYYKFAGASESVTVTVGPYSNSTSRGVHIYEYSGVDSSNALEDTASAAGSGNNITFGSVTTSQEAMVIAGVTQNISTQFEDWTDSFIERRDFVNSGSPTNKSTYAGAHVISLTADTFSPDATSDSSAVWIGQMLAFNAAQNCACTVTTVADAGPGSLREAMTKANNCTGATISFNIPGPCNASKGSDSWWRIQPDSALPLVYSRSTTIDATTQTTNQGDSNSVGPEIEINGDNAGTCDGLDVRKPDAIIKGLALNGFDGVSQAGVLLYDDSASRGTVQGCYLGVSATGDSAIPNYYGLYLNGGAADCVIGGSSAGQGNVISGNTDYGVFNGSSGNRTTYFGNFIGTNAACGAAIANGDDGLMVSSCRAVIIGGPNAGEGNVISGNTDHGLYGASADSLIIRGNKIGVDSSGTTIIANVTGGLYLSGCDSAFIGGSAAGAGNIISGNTGFGVSMIISDYATFYGNKIGTGPNGTETGLGNGGDYSIGMTYVTVNPVGAATIGGLGAGEGNIIAEGPSDGIYIKLPGWNIEIAGNTIRDHVDDGIYADSSGVKILGNLIYGNSDDGINCNFKDTTTYIYHNTIHGNGGDGIQTSKSYDSTVVRNNIITGNANYGIRRLSGTLVESHNLITDDVTNPANISGRSTETLDASDWNADPQYVDTTTSDFSLTECTSPAINAGVDLGGDQPDMNGAEAGDFTGPYPDMGAFESTCLLVLSVAVNNPNFAFGFIPLDQWLTPESSLVINDGSGAQNFLGRLSQFTDGSNTWDIDAAGNGADTVRVQWSTTSDAGPWTSISAYNNDFTFATNVAASDTVTIWFRLQTPVTTTSIEEYSSQFTVTAESF